jgi:two-component system OmpR family response regulator
MLKASLRVKALLTKTPPRAPRLLVVDDEPPMLEYVRRVLTSIGYDVVTALSGPDALSIAAAGGPFDAMVTDLVMPTMNGDELARRMRTRTPDLKVLYLTGYSDKLFKEKVVLWDDEAFLDKPASIEGLRQAVALLVYGSIEAHVSDSRPSAPTVGA